MAWLSYFAPKVWDMIPLEIKNIDSLQKFRTEIKNGLHKTVLVIFVVVVVVILVIFDLFM